MNNTMGNSTATCIMFYSILFVCTSGGFMRNKYIVEIEGVEACSKSLKEMNPLRNLQFRRFNRTHKTLSFDFTYDRPIDEKIGGSISIYRWGNAGWIALPFMGLQPNVCKYFGKAFKASWVAYHRLAGVPQPDHCPIPAGNYSVKDYILASDFRVPFFSGQFKVDIVFQDITNKDVVFCMVARCKVTEMLN